MKTKLSLFIAFIVCAAISTTAHAAKCSGPYECANSSHNRVSNLPETRVGCITRERCYSIEDNEYWDVAVEDCGSCESGYTRTGITTFIPYCENDIVYWGCVKNEQGGASCGGVVCDSPRYETNGAWATYVYYTCVSGSCVENRDAPVCARGYVNNGQGGCDTCPAENGLYGTTDAYDSIEADCYLPKGTVFSDESGSGTYTSDCHYD